MLMITARSGKGMGTAVAGTGRQRESISDSDGDPREETRAFPETAGLPQLHHEERFKCPERTYTE